jgi:transcriptional regulator GlxA family with amidase domain
MHAQFVLFDGVDPLDVIAPFEVLAAASDFVGDDLVIEMVSSGEAPRSFVSGTRGLQIAATSQLDTTLGGYVILPGASGLVEGDPDEGVETIPVILARVAQSSIIPPIAEALANPEITVVTVCGGGLILGMAGLIEGRTATTHALGLEVLEATGVHVSDARVVDDGDLISGGGVTNGLDVGLYLAEKIYGPEIAMKVERLFQFERRGTVWRRPREVAAA